MGRSVTFIIGTLQLRQTESGLAMRWLELGYLACTAGFLTHDGTVCYQWEPLRLWSLHGAPV